MVTKAASKKAVKPQKKALASDPEYIRQRRLRLNPDVYSRIAVKAKNYLTVKQAQQVENSIDKIIGIEPRNR